MGAMIAAAAIGAVGSGLSFMGASKNAKAAQEAAGLGMKDEKKLYKKWSSQLDSVMDSKEDKLYNLGNIFDRFESTGAFGNTDTLKNLRQAQEDFSALAAGDFSSFESQLRKSMSDALVNTVGTGSPIGSFAQLAADTQMNYRLQGVQTATGLTESLSNQANSLLGMEFGIMDQRFQVGYEMDAAKTRNINALRTQQAANVGVGWQAAGMGISQIGNSIANVAQHRNNVENQNRSYDLQMAKINKMSGGNQPRATPMSQASTGYSGGSGGFDSYSGNMDYSSVTPMPFLPTDVSYSTDDFDLLLPPRQGQSSSGDSNGIASTWGRGMAEITGSNPYVKLGYQIMSGNKQ